MPDFDDQLPPFKKKQDAGPGSTTPSEIFVLCAELESAFHVLMKIQAQLDSEFLTHFSTCNIENILRQIRAVRQECSQIADGLLEMSPETLHENITMNKAIMMYLAYVGVDRMTCRPRFDAALDSERPDPGATSSEAKSARMFSLSTIPWKGWTRVSFLPKLR